VWAQSSAFAKRDIAYLRNVERVSRLVKALFGEGDFAFLLNAAQRENEGTASSGNSDGDGDMKLVLWHLRRRARA
jgi:hypothetical protein